MRQVVKLILAAGSDPVQLVNGALGHPDHLLMLLPEVVGPRAPDSEPRTVSLYRQGHRTFTRRDGARTAMVEYVEDAVPPQVDFASDADVSAQYPGEGAP